MSRGAQDSPGDSPAHVDVGGQVMGRPLQVGGAGFDGFDPSRPPR
ncbi:MAG: hypothetical protein ACKOQZ_12225 [Actinomycetota bacterium]